MSDMPSQQKKPENPQTLAGRYYDRALNLWQAQHSPRNDKKKALQLWLHAANHLNHTPSAVWAAYVLDKNPNINGERVVPVDMVHAKQLYERAAYAGNAMAMNNLGYLLECGGQGIEQDVIRAKKLYERAADAGNAMAMKNLGRLLERGAEGIEQDKTRAKKFYEGAAASGIVCAAMRLRKYQETGLMAQPNSPRFRDIAMKPTGDENATLHERENGDFSEGTVLPHYNGSVRRPHYQAQEHLSFLGLLLRARSFATGDENTPRNEIKAAQCYKETVRLARTVEEEVLVQTEYGRFMLELGELDEQAPLKSKRERLEKAIQLLEQSLTIRPLSSAVNDLINVYTYSTISGLRNPQRENELRRLNIVYRHPYFRDDMVRYLKAGSDSDRRLIFLMRDAVVKPRSCLLLILGAPGRGKTATLNSLRGLPFVKYHEPTQLAEISQFVIEPGSRIIDEGMLRDLDFRENSFPAIASRLHPEDIAKCEKNIVTDTSRADAVACKHRNVLERVRGAATRSEIGCKNSQFLRCWDMGGQSEYEMAHSLFIARADILLFVVNLKRVQDDETREEEIKKLCCWMQLAHMTVKDPSKVRVIVVGTHKGEVDCEDDVIDLLVENMRLLLAENMDHFWAKDTGERSSFLFVAVENSATIEDTVESGLESLTRALKRFMADVLSQREAIPLKWLALVDKMRRIQGGKKVLWTRKEVEKLCEYFPGFPAEEHFRNEELLQGLRKMTTLTGVTSTVLFELGNCEWVVSVSPERVVGMFRLVTSWRSWKKCLQPNDLKRLEQSGTLYEDTLKSEIWGRKYDEAEKQAMINLLCECDLLIRLRDSDTHERGSRALYGVPCLLRSSKPLSKKQFENEEIVEMVTKFHNSLPVGLQGGLMANLSRTVQDDALHVGLVGESSALLELKEGRVIVEYKMAEREIVWTGIGRHPLDLVDKGLKQMDQFLSHRAHPIRVRRRTIFRYKHCSSPDDLEVFHSELRRSDLTVRCKVCKAPKQVSKLCKSLVSNESGSPDEAGHIRNPDFRFASVDVLRGILTRREAVCDYFGCMALEEASKGLSRVLELSSESDIKKFGEQLQRCDKGAYEKDYTNCWEEDGFCFAISYKQLDEKDKRKGRFKFSSDQWENLEAVLKEIGKRGVSRCRIWLDQCLWLRDAPQECWAVSGLFPYLLWPVIALGDRKFKSDRTTVTYERMWPFIEEVLGLWSLGVITASEERGSREADGCRKWMIRKHRQRLKPEESMRLLFLNIYHGGTEGLKTGWAEDVRELQDIAKWNVESRKDKLVVRSDWRQEASQIANQGVSKSLVGTLREMALCRGEKREFLDVSKQIERKGKWDGLKEWTSGRLNDVNMSREQMDTLMEKMTKINVLTDTGSFVLLGFEPSEDYAVWVLAAMTENRKSNRFGNLMSKSFFLGKSRSKIFRLGNARWTKIVQGQTSCELRRNSKSDVVTWVLNEQLGRAVGEVRVVDADYS